MAQALELLLWQPLVPSTLKLRNPYPDESCISSKVKSEMSYSFLISIFLLLCSDSLVQEIQHIRFMVAQGL